MSEHQSENFEEPPRKMRRASEEDVNRTDEKGRSPLHHAARAGDVRWVRELVSRGADTRLRDGEGRTPLHSALWVLGGEAADLLAKLDSGNDVEDGEGRTPLHSAAVGGHVEAMRTLLAGGARTRVPDRRGRTPLHWALYCGEKDAAELLAEADGGIELRDRRGRTPLHCAAQKAFRRVVATLLYNDVNPHIRDEEGNYPLQLSLRGRRHDDVPKMILSSCALKGIVVDWAELNLAPDDLRFCVEEVSLCSREIRLMQNARVGASRLSYHDLLTRHVSAVAPRLTSESVRGVLRERDFPHYADRISLRLRSARVRRASVDRCLRCFSRLPPELPPFPVTCRGVVLRCLGEAEMEYFVHAVQSPSRE